MVPYLLFYPLISTMSIYLVKIINVNYGMQVIFKIFNSKVSV